MGDTMRNLLIRCSKNIVKNTIPASYLHKYKKLGYIKRPEPPVVYNAKGEQMYVFFIKSLANAHHPYELTEGRRSETILWDRFNYGLDTHFYGSEDLFAWEGHPKYAYGMLHESESIIPYVYKEVRRRRDFIKKFNYFFTHTEDLLDSFENARFLPANGVWYGSTVWGGDMETMPEKNKLVSLVSSKTFNHVYLILSLSLLILLLFCLNSRIYFIFLSFILIFLFFFLFWPNILSQLLSEFSLLCISFSTF